MDVLRKHIQEFLQNNDTTEIRGLYHTIIHQVELTLIECVLEHTNGNQTEAAKILGISRNTLQRRIKNT